MANYEIKNAGDVFQFVAGCALLGFIGIPGAIQGIDAHFNHVDIAMGEGTEAVKIGTYNCSNRTFNPVSNTKVAEAATKEWIDEREFGAAMDGGWMGNIITNGIFNRFDDICDAR